MFNNKEDAIKFEDKLMCEFLVRGSRLEDYMAKEVVETYYYCDEDLMENHKAEMLENGWVVDESKGNVGVVYRDIDRVWDYSSLVYKYDMR